MIFSLFYQFSGKSIFLVEHAPKELQHTALGGGQLSGQGSLQLPDHVPSPEQRRPQLTAQYILFRRHLPYSNLGHSNCQPYNYLLQVSITSLFSSLFNLHLHSYIQFTLKLKRISLLIFYLWEKAVYHWWALLVHGKNYKYAIKLTGVGFECGPTQSSHQFGQTQL